MPSRVPYWLKTNGAVGFPNSVIIMLTPYQSTKMAVFPSNNDESTHIDAGSTLIIQPLKSKWAPRSASGQFACSARSSGQTSAALRPPDQWGRKNKHELAKKGKPLPSSFFGYDSRMHIDCTSGMSDNIHMQFARGKANKHDESCTCSPRALWKIAPARPAAGHVGWPSCDPS